MFIDGNASMGIGARPGNREQRGPKALGPWGNPHVNLAGQEMLEWLQIEGLASARSFRRARGDRHGTWWHPKTGLPYSLDYILVRQRQIGRVKQACTRSSTRTRTRTNTIPNGTKANAAGLSGRAREVRVRSGMGGGVGQARKCKALG